MQIFIVIVVGEPKRDSHFTAAPNMASLVGNDSQVVVYRWLFFCYLFILWNLESSYQICCPYLMYKITSESVICLCPHSYVYHMPRGVTRAADAVTSSHHW